MSYFSNIQQLLLLLLYFYNMKKSFSEIVLKVPVFGTFLVHFTDTNTLHLTTQSTNSTKISQYNLNSTKENAMIYIVHNHNTNEQETLSEQQLEDRHNELKLNILEIIDEMDDRPFTINYTQAQSLNECITSLWELVAFKDNLSKDDIIQTLSDVLPKIDQAFKQDTSVCQ